MSIRLARVLALAALVFAPLAHADFYLIVQAANPQPALTRKEAVDLYMGRTRAFPRGEVAKVYDLPRDSARRDDFYQSLTGMGPAQVNSYWARLMFSGRTMPPLSVADEAAMVQAVRQDPHALGWVSRPPDDRQVRIVLVIKDAD